MRKRVVANTCAALCLVALVASFIWSFYTAWEVGNFAIVELLVGIVISLVFAPILHELGHIVFAHFADMEIMYSKFFCFRLIRENGKLHFGFASPFVMEETQVLPKRGGAMQRRTSAYTLGGLIVSGIVLGVILALAIVFTSNFLLWGLVPYTGYLFLLNLLPVEYVNGKTDTLVYRGIKRGYDTERVMISAMEIQGRLYAGESFSQIEEACYYEVPQLAEDEPLFVVMLDLRYFYHLEKEEFEKAAACLNRLVSLQAYMSDWDMEKVAAELVYMHAINGDYERAKACSESCVEYLKGDWAQAKRILAAYTSAFGQAEAVPLLKAQAEEALQSESVEGVRKLERILLSRISVA